MVRDEADIIAATLHHMVAEGVDGIVIADNRSTDGTRALIEGVADRVPVPVVLVDDPEIGYYQSRKMTALARRAADLGASWIVPFDADEIWYADSDKNLADVLRSQDPAVTTVSATLLNHYETAFDADEGVPFRAMVYRKREPGALPKVAFRWHDDAVIGQGNHSVDVPGDVSTSTAGVALRHFAYRGADHFVRKARNGYEAYLATDLGPNVGAHWRQYGETLERSGEEALRAHYAAWFRFDYPADAGMVWDPAPFMRWNDVD